MTAMRMPSRRAIFFRSWMSWIGTPPRDCWPTFSRSVSNSAAISKPSWRKPGIVGQREAEVARAHDGDAQLAIEPEDLAQVALQVPDVVADAAHAELAEVGQVLADLRGVQVELLGQRLRRDRPDARAVEHIQAAQVDGQAVGGELGNLVAAWLAGVSAGVRLVVTRAEGFVRSFHKPGRDCSKNTLISRPYGHAASDARLS